MKQINFESFDGEKIVCHLWTPKEEPKGIVQIIHGLQEHSLRYKEFASFLARYGYIVLASDQRLHGLTAGNKISKTDIKDVFPIMVKDQMMIADWLIKTYDKPLVVMGHSYGSFEVQSFIQKYNKHAGTIICGSAYMKRIDTLFAKYLTAAAVKIMGNEVNTKPFEDLLIELYNRQLDGKGNWISANEENLKNIEEDPLCGNALCANFYASMFKNVRTLYTQKGLNNIDKTKPIFIVSGKEDPVGKKGQSTRKLYEVYKENGLNVKIKLYEGMRHEIINEDKSHIVYLELLEFINNCCEDNIHNELN